MVLDLRKEYKVAANSVQSDIKFTRAEKEKEQQAEAYQELMISYPLPGNMSEMKTFIIGSLTLRDVFLISASELIPVMIMFLISSMFPPGAQIIFIILGVIIGLPFSWLSIKHVFTGDIPIEEKIKIALSEKGKSNLFFWDKTKDKHGNYVESSTQSFVPNLIFTSDNYTLLPHSKGGFSVIELNVDDLAQAKNTDLVGIVHSFERMLNALIQDTDCIPIQIMLKSIPKNLKSYIDTAEQRTYEIQSEGKHVEAERADDYARLLYSLDMEKAFYYQYYIVVTYREDAEHVGEDTMNTAGVKREKLKEKGLNPLNKKMRSAKNVDFKVGMTQEERKTAIKAVEKGKEFSELKTRLALERRVSIVLNMLRELGSTHTDVQARLLTRHDMSKLIYDCYNVSDKNVVDAVLDSAIENKDALYSIPMYRDFPELFSIKSFSKRDDSISGTQKANALRSSQRA